MASAARSGGEGRLNRQRVNSRLRKERDCACASSLTGLALAGIGLRSCQARPSDEEIGAGALEGAVMGHPGFDARWIPS